MCPLLPLGNKKLSAPHVPIRDAQKKGLLHMDIGTGTYSYSADKVIICIEDEANYYKIPFAFV